MFPERAAEIEHVVMGRAASARDIARRLRIVPLLSIGHMHVSPSIRRVLIEMPADCPFARNDLSVALANQTADRIDAATGEVQAEGPILIPADDDTMLAHYGVGDNATRRWQSVTPVALPEQRQKGRVRGSERAAADATRRRCGRDGAAPRRARLARHRGAGAVGAVPPQGRARRRLQSPTASPAGCGTSRWCFPNRSQVRW